MSQMKVPYGEFEIQCMDEHAAKHALHEKQKELTYKVEQMQAKIKHFQNIATSRVAKTMEMMIWKVKWEMDNPKVSSKRKWLKSKATSSTPNALVAGSRGTT